MARLFHWHGRGGHGHGGLGRFHNHWHNRWRHHEHPGGGGGGGDDDGGGDGDGGDHGFHLPLPPLLPPFLEVGEPQEVGSENEAEMRHNRRRRRYSDQDNREVDEREEVPLQADGETDMPRRAGRWFRHHGRIVVLGA
jgi:hypothetical protein